jgi:integrase
MDERREAPDQVQLASVRRLELAALADETARQGAFADYRSRRAENTLRRQDAELANFAAYIGMEGLATAPNAWTGVTWGIVDSFVKKLLMDGYAVGTVNNHLSTIKTYAKLAAKAGALSVQRLAMIRTVAGYAHREAKRIDEKRAGAGIETRLGTKKDMARVLTEAQEVALKGPCDDTPQGLRDRVLLVLLLDLGLRVSEAVDLQVADFDWGTGKLVVNRRKTDSVTTFELRNAKRATLHAYLEVVEPAGQLLRGSRKDGTLVGGMSNRAVRARICAMGNRLGIDHLSPHDLRHTRATRLASSLNVRQLMDWFGWNSPAMAARYIESVQHIIVE